LGKANPYSAYCSQANKAPCQLQRPAIQAFSGGKPLAALPEMAPDRPIRAPIVPAAGSIFLNFCTLYWGCRFAGYGNKLPSQ
jgi:hypothetical protein